MQFLANIRLFMVDEKPEFTTLKQNRIHFVPKPADTRSKPVRSERGDRVFYVECNPKALNGNTSRPALSHRRSQSHSSNY